jgi:hypothetical protein
MITSTYLTLTVKYQNQKFDVEKSHFKRGKIIYSIIFIYVELFNDYVVGCSCSHIYSGVLIIVQELFFSHHQARVCVWWDDHQPHHTHPHTHACLVMREKQFLCACGERGFKHTRGREQSERWRENKWISTSITTLL